MERAKEAYLLDHKRINATIGVIVYANDRLHTFVRRPMPMQIAQQLVLQLYMFTKERDTSAICFSCNTRDTCHTIAPCAPFNALNAFTVCRACHKCYINNPILVSRLSLDIGCLICQIDSSECLIIQRSQNRLYKIVCYLSDYMETIYPISYNCPE